MIGQRNLIKPEPSCYRKEMGQRLGPTEEPGEMVGAVRDARLGSVIGRERPTTIDLDES